MDGLAWLKHVSCKGKKFDTPQQCSSDWEFWENEKWNTDEKLVLNCNDKGNILSQFGKVYLINVSFRVMVISVQILYFIYFQNPLIVRVVALLIPMDMEIAQSHTNKGQYAI